jgi:hypothetical protein
MRNIAGIMVVLFGAVVACGETPGMRGGELVTRQYDVLPNCSEHVGSFSERGPSGGAGGEADAWKKFFEVLGVKWPEGSSIKYVPAVGKLYVRNTPENLVTFEKVLASLNIVPHQVEIEVDFVSFDKGDVATLAAKGVTVEGLTGLWGAGKAKLVAAPRITTQSGVQATAKGVTECIYPTETTVSLPAGSDSNATAAVTGYVAEPGNFEMREIGAILTVLPELDPSGRMINLTLTPEYVEEPTWREYGMTGTDPKGGLHKLAAEQPFFHTYSFNTTLTVADGVRVLASGGMPTRDDSRLVYAFVTAWIVGIGNSPAQGQEPVRP